MERKLNFSKAHRHDDMKTEYYRLIHPEKESSGTHNTQENLILPRWQQVDKWSKLFSDILPFWELTSLPLSTIMEIVLKSPAHPITTTDLSRTWEYLFEYIRREFYPHLNSRLTSLHLYDNIVQAHTMQDECDIEYLRPIVSITIYNPQMIEKHDSFWREAPTVDCKYTDFLQSAQNYWLGIASDNSHWEYLYKGSYSL